MNELAATILTTIDGRRQIAQISASRPEFGLDQAYSVAGEVMAARIARGERVGGWKIGFTNSSIWDEYGVRAPIWGPMYAAGITSTSLEKAVSLEAAAFLEPRIEPEIVLRIGGVPRAEMDDTDLIACIDAVGHGFEIVQSIFPGWKFAAADTVAAGSLHGAFVHGPLQSVQAQDRVAWIERLTSFSITLSRQGDVVDTGVAANVLGGPLSAFRHFLAGLETQPLGRGVEPGDLVTTGTVTRAFPVKAGERWSTEVAGLPLPGMVLDFT